MDEMLMFRIRERAYEIWIASGGDAKENWLRAEAEVLKNSNTGSVSSPIKKKRRDGPCRPRVSSGNQSVGRPTSFS
jgi:hypothetical protein